MFLKLCFAFTLLEVLAMIETILNLCLVVMVHKHKENISVPYKINSTQSPQNNRRQTDEVPFPVTCPEKERLQDNEQGNWIQRYFYPRFSCWI